VFHITGEIYYKYGCNEIHILIRHFLWPVSELEVKNSLSVKCSSAVRKCFCRNIYVFGSRLRLITFHNCYLLLIKILNVLILIIYIFLNIWSSCFNWTVLLPTWCNTHCSLSFVGVSPLIFSYLPYNLPNIFVGDYGTSLVQQWLKSVTSLIISRWIPFLSRRIHLCMSTWKLVSDLIYFAETFQFSM
jgi:hypothetical protein